MSLRDFDCLSPMGFTLMAHCYRFVNVDWQHAVRELIPDQGFEMRFRDGCTLKLAGWVISQHRELHLGCGIEPASGVCHEVDIVAQCDETMAIIEIKNRPGSPPEKNDVIVFFAKMIDYLAATPTLLRREVVPIFVSSSAFEHSGLAACIGLGIHPIAPSMRPFPLLIDGARRMQIELDRGVSVSSSIRENFDDFCSTLNRLSVSLLATSLDERCDCLTDTSIVFHTISRLSTGELADDLYRANAIFIDLLSAFQAAKAAGSTS
jgi:hypothetical protein